MVYQNNLMPFEGRRVHPILLHYEWLDYAKKEVLDFTSLSEPFTKKPLGLTPSELSQLPDVDKNDWRDNLLNLELIFLALEEEVMEKNRVEKNIQALNESYNAVIKNRRITRLERANFDHETSQSGLAA